MVTHPTKAMPRERGDEQASGYSGETARLEGTMGRWMMRPWEFWLRCQADILRAAEPATISWLQRRRDGADAGMQAMARLAACSDLKEAAAIQRDWFEGAVKRLAADLQAFAEQAAALSHEAMSASQHAAEATAEPVAAALHAAAQKERQVDRAA